MVLSVAERQARRREKLRTQGKTLFQAWVTPAQAAQIRSHLRGSAVTSHGRPARPATSHASAKRKGRKRDPVAEVNERICDARRSEIAARLRAGQKPTQIAAWLGSLGFVGTGATLNGFLKASPLRQP